MRRAGALRPTIPLLLLCIALTASCGCGDRGKSAAGGSALTFEQLPDTAGLSNGAPILKDFDAYRMPGGALRVKANVRLPEGARVQVAIKRAAGQPSLAMTHAVVQGGVIESLPMMSESGPLPVARYRFEISAQFTSGWQSPAVLRATEDGKSLRGPGITRTRVGGAMFLLVEEKTL